MLGEPDQRPKLLLYYLTFSLDEDPQQKAQEVTYSVFKLSSFDLLHLSSSALSPRTETVRRIVSYSESHLCEGEYARGQRLLADTEPYRREFVRMGVSEPAMREAAARALKERLQGRAGGRHQDLDCGTVQIAFKRHIFL